MDPLSDVLSLLRLRTYTAFGFDAAGAWAFGFGAHDGIKFYAATSGQCWLEVDGVADPIHVEQGDCFLLLRGRAFRVASDLSVPAIDGATMLPPKLDGITRVNGGGDVFCVGGYFELTGDYARVLRGMLPPIVHLRSQEDRDILCWCGERMQAELKQPRPGGSLIVQQLVTMMLVTALRLHLAASDAGVGWLFALADPQLAAAITAMHDEPARRWTLALLARRAGMSRTSFALRFKRAVGLSAMDYLTRWRMLVAGDRLARSNEPIAALAPSLGYDSESAFSTAFKRVMGCSPRQYSRDPRPTGG